MCHILLKNYSVYVAAACSVFLLYGYYLDEAIKVYTIPEHPTTRLDCGHGLLGVIVNQFAPLRFVQVLHDTVYYSV